MKVCKKCKLIKPLTEFYPHSLMRDGYLNTCKACTLIRIRTHRKNNLERIRYYDRIRGRLPERLLANKLRGGGQGRSGATKQWRNRNPEKYKAHIILNNAIRDGKITRGNCCVCGVRKVEAHHEDYNLPLEVQWLCRTHHALLHRKYE